MILPVDVRSSGASPALALTPPVNAG